MLAVPPQNSEFRSANKRKRMIRSRKNDRRQGAFAALDLGTNNCRLLVAKPMKDGFRIVDGFSRIVRLGEGVSELGALSDAAVQRTIEALKICAQKMSQQRVSKARCVATQAARSASNGVYFVDRVKAETGINLEIISSQEEAELTLTGCLSLLDTSYDYTLMFDVGGGSAEFVWARILPIEGAKILGWTSLPLGVVTLTERHGKSEFDPLEYENLVSSLIKILRPFDLEFGISEHIVGDRVQIVGTAGTVTTIAGVNMCLPRYNRSRVDGCWLDYNAVRRVSRMLRNQSYDERAAHPCIGHTRAELVVAGCAVLEAVCNIWPAGRLRVADRGVREGILNVMSGQPRVSGHGAISFAAE